jgi:hypothetical protein
MAFSWQAEQPLLFQLPNLLFALFDQCPACIPAALGGNLTPGLVRMLRNLRPGSPAVTQDPVDCGLVLGSTLFCFLSLMASSPAFWRPAIDAGVVPVLIAMLRIPHESTLVSLLHLSSSLLLAAPKGSVEGWAPGLLQAIAGLVNATPPVAPGVAAATLLNLGLVRRDMLLDFHTWGLVESLQQLKMHGNSYVAAAAKGLLSVVHRVSQRLLTLVLALHNPSLPFPCGILIPLMTIHNHVYMWVMAWGFPWTLLHCCSACSRESFADGQ